MAEQSVDLRSALSILRRHRLALALTALVGALAGVGFVFLQPPMYSSTSSVLLPPVKAVDGQAPARDVTTEIRVATSDVVLRPAGQALSPPLPARLLAHRVHVSAPSTDILQIVASADTAARAEAISQAVAEAELAFITRAGSSLTSAEAAALDQREQDLQESLDTVTAEIKETQARRAEEDPTSTQGRADASALAQLTAQQGSLVLQIDQVKQKAATSEPDGGAQIIDPASPGRRPKLVEKSVVLGMIGLLLAEAGMSTFLIVTGKRDRRLRYRDEMADALGSPVLASVRSRSPRNVAGWESLLEDYTPGTVDAWALRQALRQLALSGPAGAGSRRGERGEGMLHPDSITVIALSGDAAGLAMGPQLAAYAAAAGLRTALVAAQRHESAVALWAACSHQGAEVRPGLFVGTEPTRAEDLDLTVVLAVLDRDRPELAELAGVRASSVTVLALSSGSATAQELALTAVNADDAGSRIDGIVVADPDNLDRTTGRLLQHDRAHEVPLPSHLTGMPSSTPRRGNVSGLRRRPR